MNVTDDLAEIKEKLAALADFELRTLDIANRLHGITYAEWKRVRYLIDKKFKAKKKELELHIQLSIVEEKDL